ncbi:hypothetical protein [Aeromicrobium sp. Leaf350]|uniref:hypothetical protein n=1 Tax=Aeromicrobium sp. Leaf350 TaxID=2876565 RepID=UPI001E65BD56|nr:hypothetical protein [Aeromicrobium sp. Leaf350]
MDFQVFWWSLAAAGFVIEAVGAWGIYDLSKLPEPAWQAAGKDRVTWMILFAVLGPFVLPFYVPVRAAVRRAQAELPPPVPWGHQPAPPGVFVHSHHE